MQTEQKRIPEPLRSKVVEGVRAGLVKDYEALRKISLELIGMDGGMDLLKDGRYDDDLIAIRAEVRPK